MSEVKLPEKWLVSPVGVDGSQYFDREVRVVRGDAGAPSSLSATLSLHPQEPLGTYVTLVVTFTQREDLRGKLLAERLAATVSEFLAEHGLDAPKETTP